MFPILFKIGPFTMYTFNIFMILACILGAFIFWRKTHFEHYEDDEVFDITLMSILFGIFSARVGFILFHFTDFQFDLLSWISLFQKPGLNEVFGLFGGLWFLGWQAKKKKWDHFEILDFAGLGITFFLSVLWIARFFSGSQIGTSTNLPIGLIFPNTLEKRHPVQLYMGLSFIIAYLILAKLEPRYRFFSWYRGNKQAAQSGLLLGVFLILYGLVNGMWSFLRMPDLRLGSFPVDGVLYLITAISGMALIFFRSGHWKGPKKPTKKAAQNRVQLNWLQRTLKRN